LQKCNRVFFMPENNQTALNNQPRNCAINASANPSALPSVINTNRPIPSSEALVCKVVAG